MIGWAWLLSLGTLTAQTWFLQPTGTDASFRGVSVVDANVVWASGTGGTYLRTLDGGAHWTAAAVPGAGKLDFRGVHAFDRDHAILMSSGEGGLSTLYETHDGGRTWTLLLRDPDPKGFFDSIAFADLKHGFVLGDPVDSKFVVLVTADRGRSWSRTGFASSPLGEGGFAASNTALITFHSNVWMATGGKGGARVARFRVGHKCCAVVQTPIRHDAEGAGIFSLAFRDAKHGIAVGGDYSQPNESSLNYALTVDGGLTWRTPGGSAPRGYRSAVAWLPRHKLWITTGPSGSETSRDGQNWAPFGEKGFNAIAVGPGDVCWSVGNKGTVAKLVLPNPSSK